MRSIIIFMAIALLACRNEQVVRYEHTCECAPDSIKQKVKDYCFECFNKAAETQNQKVKISGNKVKKNSFNNNLHDYCYESAVKLYYPRQRIITIQENSGLDIVTDINADCNPEQYYEYRKMYDPK